MRTLAYALKAAAPELARRATCASKRPHSTWAHAERVLRSMVRRGDAPPGALVIYECGVCGQFHIGNDPVTRRRP